MSPVLLEGRFDQPSPDALSRLPRPATNLRRDRPGASDEPTITDIHQAGETLPDWLRNHDAGVKPLGADEVVSIDSDNGTRARPGAATSIATLAYYLPYHFHRNDWGIYLRATGIESLAITLTAGIEESLPIDIVDMARWLLYAHEYFHCVLETAATRIELVGGAHVYPQYLDEFGSRHHEEAMANANSIAFAERRYADIVPALRAWMLTLPRGYRDFGPWQGRGGFQRGRGEAADRLMHHLPEGALDRPLPSELGEFVVEDVPRSHIPTYLVSEPTSALGVFRPFPKFEGMRVLVHTNDHPPPHFHLELPAGQPRGRFEWPSLKPLRGAAALSGKEGASLKRYLARFGHEVFEKLHAVYGAAVEPVESART